MTLKKDQKYAIAVILALLVALITVFLLKNYGTATKSALLTSLIPFSLFLVVGLMWASKNKKEKFSLSGDGNFDQTQTINIVQNCGSNPGPSPNPNPPNPTPPSPLTKDMVLKWIKSVNPKLSSSCNDCIIANVIKLWNVDTLNKVMKDPMTQQEIILNAILAFDCSNQCTTSSKLNSAQVDQWLHELDPSLSASCHQCVMKLILKSWSLEQYANMLKLDKDKQLNVIQGILAFSCADCNTPSNLTPQEVQQWMASLISGASQECYECALSAIMKMWSSIDFAKVKALSKENQIQTLKALMALDCSKDCISIPSGLNENDVKNWLDDILINGELANCVDSCIVPAIMKSWSPEMFADVKIKPRIEQQKILQALISLNCGNACFGGALSKGEVAYIVSLVLPEAKSDCVDCIASEVMNSMSSIEFNNLLAKPVAEQMKVFRALASYKCPGLCVLPPAQECDYPAY